jgi:hypothetical protein
MITVAGGTNEDSKPWMQTGPVRAAQDGLPTAVKIHPRLGDWLSNNQAKQLTENPAAWCGGLCAAIANQRFAELETGVDDASAICSMGNSSAKSEDVP